MLFNDSNPARTSAAPRFQSDAGIAIGPILFIIAILAILGAAIAAGSGSFTAGTTSEAAKMQATALIQIGENLQSGVSYLMSRNNISDPSQITYGTTLDTDLFSPTGGAIIQPSTAYMTPNPTYVEMSSWHYMMTITVGGFGTSADDLFAFSYIGNDSNALVKCNAINIQANGVTSVPTVTIALIAAASPTHTSFNADFGPLNNKMTGCFYTSHIYSAGYWFYQVLSVQ